MHTDRIIRAIGYIVVLTLGSSLGWAENIDPDENGKQYAYGENVGWLNFEPGEGPGVHVSETQLTGYVWAENIGWINLAPASHGGVVNDGGGNLSGYAWGENVGWINFSPTVSGDPIHYGVTIDSEGNFDGWAWGENIGWIHVQSPTNAPVEYKVKVCMVSLEDLSLFCHQWLDNGEVAANLDWATDPNPSNNVDFIDYSILASYWLSYCPDDWSL
jgi:hypothetical protein